jgi:hypothetical protein
MAVSLSLENVPQHNYEQRHTPAPKTANMRNYCIAFNLRHDYTPEIAKILQKIMAIEITECNII